ncbi:unnamed protein product [Cyclocybe aegerita]|uniref:Uncharacterized protein n=1 Tax=Cyclocybe aegerita TaxID=1973307 RepID=A0A8S0W9I5_CYCAE|nr:unnamed protein product [Cyclocybe aegerita]
MTDDPASILTPHLPISAMDEHYDINAAKTSLEQMSKERMPNHLQLCKFDMEEGLHRFVQPTYTEYPRCWKLTYLDNNGGIEEVVLQVQGIITGSTMPPIKWPFKIEPCQRAYFCQSAALTGFGSESFADAIRCIEEIHNIFARHFPEESLELWNASSSAGYLTIDMANRYFTPRSQASPDQIISSFAIDPDGILAACTTDGTLVHTKDNSVEYYEHYQEGEKQQYEAIDPIKFRIGDIAEAQVSFIVIHLKEQKYKMLIVMQALTLLDSSPLRVHTNRRSTVNMRDVARATRKRNPLCRPPLMTGPAPIRVAVSIDTRTTPPTQRHVREHAARRQLTNTPGVG